MSDRIGVVMGFTFNIFFFKLVFFLFYFLSVFFAVGGWKAHLKTGAVTVHLQENEEGYY